MKWLRKLRTYCWRCDNTGVLRVRGDLIPRSYLAAHDPVEFADQMVNGGSAWWPAYVRCPGRKHSWN